MYILSIVMRWLQGKQQISTAVNKVRIVRERSKLESCWVLGGTNENEP